jgi:hypothetical protein
MRRILFLTILIWLPSLTASAQIGWTLQQCRQHFGHEIKEPYTSMLADTGPDALTFGIKYRHYTRQENLDRDAPVNSFDGILTRVRLDPDGTVEISKRCSVLAWSGWPRCASILLRKLFIAARG